ncbi:MAG: hypothetical protein K1X75_10665 [Leptospirales bacterium]|nr:hypothetical protein [Leptospirales bacterium]
MPRAPRLSDSQSRAAEQSALQAAIARLAPEQILWPEEHIAAFPESARQRSGRKTSVPLLANPLQRVELAALSMQDRLSQEILSAAQCYWIWTRFIETLQGNSARAPKKKASKKAATKTAVSRAASAAVEQAAQLQAAMLRAQCFRDQLTVGKEVRSAASREQLVMHLIADASQASNRNELVQLKARELQLREQGAAMAAELAEERRHAQKVEARLKRLSDQETARRSEIESEIVQEHRALREEYSILSRKYDDVVSQNIRLSNELRRGPGGDLSASLDQLRERINSIVKHGALRDDRLALSALRMEVAQLQRARMYLGRALFNLGILYLRGGDRKKAVAELRAARELGVEDAETNRLLRAVR